MIIRQLEDEWALLLTYTRIGHNPTTTRGIVFSQDSQVLTIVQQNGHSLSASQQGKPVELHSEEIFIVWAVLACIKHNYKETRSTILGNIINLARLTTLLLS